MSRPDNPPRALYVHLPWCVEKCPYCDFNSHKILGDLPQSDYIQALVDDLDDDLAHFDVTQVDTIYFGGGTPSVFEPEQIATFLRAVRERLTLPSTVEITLEANPGTVDSDRFAGFKQAGVNRLSIGAQSFSNAHLRQLGRIHDQQAAIDAAQAATQVGFERFNLDLMFALPGQTQAQALADVEQGLALGAQHLSCYQLTIEPNTAFAANPPTLPDNDDSADMHDAIISRLSTAGLNRYEVSAFAADGHTCQHNLNYWQFGDYLGVGAGAHGKITQNNQVTRLARVRHPKRYLAATSRSDRLSHERVVDDDQLPFEFMLNALRLKQGFRSALFEQHTGLPLSTISTALTQATDRGLLCTQDDRIAPTPRGYQMLDNLVALFLTDNQQQSRRPPQQTVEIPHVMD